MIVGKVNFFRSLEGLGIMLLILGVFLGFKGPEVLKVNFIRMDLVPFGIGFIGVLIFIAASSVVSYEKNKTKEQEIEEKDERMIQIQQQAKSKAFDILAGVFPIILLGLAILGYMSMVSFFILAGLYLLVVLIYYYQLRLNQKNM